MDRDSPPPAGGAQRVPIAPPLLLVGVVAAAVLAAGSAVHAVVLRPPADVPAIAPRIPDVSAHYLDREAPRQQTVTPPDLVRRILLPSLGAPQGVVPPGPLRIALDAPLAPGESLVLVPREELGELDALLYALPPMPGGADLVAARKESAEAELAGESGRVVSEAEQSAFSKRFADDAYQKRLDELLAAVADESGAQVRARVAGVRDRFDAIAAARAAKLVAVTPRGACELVGVRSTCALDADVPRDLPVGLYALALRSPAGRVVDFQMNAAFRPAAPDAPPEMVMAGDMQWGSNPDVAGMALSWVSLMNALASSGRAPESILLAGDLVDCEFGSAGGLWTKLFGGATDYPRDYMQAWLVLAALRVPAHMIPGNHDGYRFEDAVGQTRSDGLLLFESTFGPLFHSFDRAPLRFVMLNSYDLPQANRTPRSTEASSVLERFSDKLNVLNWGGGLRRQQLAWLRERLGLDGAPPATLTPVLIMHQDPRGACLVLRERAVQARAVWSAQRHVPLGERPRHLRALQSTLTPHSSDTEEIHAGYYTPLRDGLSQIRSTEWFEIGGANVALPPTAGYPGWARYQQEWHGVGTYRKDFFDVQRVPGALELAPPGDVLGTIVEGRVAAIFRAHDNRFGRATMDAGESIFGKKAEAELFRVVGDDPKRRALFDRVRLRAPLRVFATTDLSDFDSDGHGFLWIRVRNGELEALEIDHR